ncbi:MAG: hypothetical protein GXO94_03150 [Nitrospirae bacterium]|nr:hypothetical protein [Nitrospirota bacterium]
MPVALDVKTVRRGFFVFSALILFVLGLNIPRVSVLAVPAALGVVFVRWRGEVVYDFLVRISVLLIFSLTYYVTMYFYDFKDLADVVISSLLITSSYALGFSLNRSNVPDWPYGFVWTVLAMVSGFAVFSFLSVYTAMSSGHVSDILFRSAPNFWVASEQINGPILGIFASLGLCLAPVLFFGSGEFIGRHRSTLMTMAVSALVAAGVYVNLTLQNRSPFIALLLSFVGAGVLFFLVKRVSPGKKVKTIAYIVIFLGVLAYMFLYMGYDYSRYSLVSRFEVQGLETSRFDAWMYMLKALPTHLAGGRLVYIGGLEYVHNLWLDVIYDAGVLPVMFLLLFHALHVKSFVSVVRADLPTILVLVIVSVGVSFMVGFLIEPVLQGSVLYFSASCFFLGLLKRLSLDLRMLRVHVMERNV